MPMPVRYRRPKWRNGTYPTSYGIRPEDLNARSEEFLQRLADITDEDAEDLRAEAIQTREHNASLYESAKAEHQALYAEVIRLYGKDSNPAKYIAKQTPEFQYQDWSERDLEDQLIKYIPTAQRILALRATEAERKAERDIVLQNAIAFLQVRGRHIVTDFTLDNAVTRADCIAYDEEVARRLAELAGGWFSFDGDDGCETCNGWDGTSPRCECGNRRLYWSASDGHSFQNPSIHPQTF
jgi:hypothetical protein